MAPEEAFVEGVHRFEDVQGPLLRENGADVRLRIGEDRSGPARERAQELLVVLEEQERDAVHDSHREGDHLLGPVDVGGEDGLLLQERVQVRHPLVAGTAPLLHGQTSDPRVGESERVDDREIGQIPHHSDDTRRQARSDADRAEEVAIDLSAHPRCRPNLQGKEGSDAVESVLGREVPADAERRDQPDGRGDGRQSQHTDRGDGPSSPTDRPLCPSSEAELTRDERDRKERHEESVLHEIAAHVGQVGAEERQRDRREGAQARLAAPTARCGQREEQRG